MSRLFIIVAMMVLVTRVFAATHIPAPTGHVNDFAGVLNSAEKKSLEETLVAYKESSKNEIAIVLIRSLDGDTVEDVAVRTFKEWKIGDKEKDNGVLFLAAIEDRKMRIEVGYGAEPFLTDGEAGQILRDAVTPSFREGKYGQGVSRAVAAIEKELSQPAQESAESAPASKPFPIPLSVLVLFFIYVCAFMARSKSVWLGGVVGAISGAAMGWWLGGVAASTVLAILFTLLGVLLDAILSRNFEVTKSKGGKTGFFSSAGGFWSSGGKSSGGFGGFSGGSSGGGGASSSW